MSMLFFFTIIFSNGYDLQAGETLILNYPPESATITITLDDEGWFSVENQYKGYDEKLRVDTLLIRENGQNLELIEYGELRTMPNPLIDAINQIDDVTFEIHMEGQTITMIAEENSFTMISPDGTETIEMEVKILEPVQN